MIELSFLLAGIVIMRGDVVSRPGCIEIDDHPHGRLAGFNLNGIVPCRRWVQLNSNEEMISAF